VARRREEELGLVAIDAVGRIEGERVLVFGLVAEEGADDRVEQGAGEIERSAGVRVELLIMSPAPASRPSTCWLAFLATALKCRVMPMLRPV
jgi:hypothetical protein